MNEKLIPDLERSIRSTSSFAASMPSSWSVY